MRLAGELEFLGLLVAVLGTGIGAYIDMKTSYIPDSVTFPMIIIGIVLLPMIYEWGMALNYYLVAAAVFGIGLLFYFFGQLGGGDVKLLTAIALLVPGYPGVLLNPIGFGFFYKNIFGLEVFLPPYPFVGSVFFIAAITSVVFISVNYLIKLFRDRKEIKDFERKFMIGIGVAVVLNMLILWWMTVSEKMWILVFPFTLGSIVYVFKDDIMRKYVAIDKRVEELTEDDVIAAELMDDATKQKLGLSLRKTFLFSSQVENLKKLAKKNKVEKVKVSEYLPRFGPFIFLSLLVNLVVVDAFLFWLLL
jgi:hypothetical protein